MKTVDDDGLHDDEDVSQTQVRSGQVNITWLPTAGPFPAVHQAPVPTAGRCQTDQSSGNSRLKRIRQKTQTIIREILQSSNQNNLKLFIFILSVVNMINKEGRKVQQLAVGW